MEYTSDSRIIQTKILLDPRNINGRWSLDGMTWELVEVAHLRPHEHIRPERVEEMYEKIKANKYFHKPILVDRSTMTILDGHHRYNASLRLGLAMMPAIVVDYLEDDTISVEAWESHETHPVTKQDVLDAATNSELMSPKSSRHTISFPFPKIHVPISELISKDS